MLKKLGFTLIELLIVISIIGILLSVTSVAYTQVSKQSRDARRKTDLEQLRGALEQYRSASAANFYPSGNYAGLYNALVSPTTYIQSLPHDPKATNPDYTYTPLSSSNGACDNTATYCVTYRLTAQLESPVFTYTVTPYGAMSTPTPIPSPSGTTGMDTGL